MKELCVRCGKETVYEINYPVDLRRWYIEGSGQLCSTCYQILYLSNIRYTDLVGPEPDEEFPFDTADSLHMGGCHVFAKALHDTLGYEMLRAELDHGFHMFCEANGRYLDASGYADTPQELVDRLPIAGRITEIKSVADVQLDEEYEQEGYGFAKRLIETHREWFRTEQ